MGVETKCGCRWRRGHHASSSRSRTNKRSHRVDPSNTRRWRFALSESIRTLDLQIVFYRKEECIYTVMYSTGIMQVRETDASERRKQGNEREWDEWDTI